MLEERTIPLSSDVTQKAFNNNVLHQVVVQSRVPVYQI